MCDSFLGEGKVGVKSGVQLPAQIVCRRKPLPAIARIAAAPLPLGGNKKSFPKPIVGTQTTVSNKKPTGFTCQFFYLVRRMFGRIKGRGNVRFLPRGRGGRG